MYFVSTPSLLKARFPDLIWDIPTADKAVYLTFDDGPTSDITPFILDTLDDYDAKATFFCLGKNATLKPEEFLAIKERGNAIGNHGFNHLDGWKVPNTTYFNDVESADNIIHSTLFRPPYGRITPSQISHLKSKFKIVLWSIMPGDFDVKLSKEKALQNLLQNIKPGSIIVLHDSDKAFPIMRYVLPNALEALKKEGYTFKALSA